MSTVRFVTSLRSRSPCTPSLSWLSPRINTRTFDAGLTGSRPLSRARARVCPRPPKIFCASLGYNNSSAPAVGKRRKPPLSPFLASVRSMKLKLHEATPAPTSQPTSAHPIPHHIRLPLIPLISIAPAFYLPCIKPGHRGESIHGGAG